MLRVSLIVLLAIAGVCAQNLPAGPPGGEAAPEPYSYGYETETHSAAEQKDPNGRVSGYYTLSDADGRSRRVEYYADESGFHAKIQTNEVGTESKNSADVEVLASPPSREQLASQPPAAQPQPQPQPQRAAAQQAYSAYSARGQTASYGQQPGYAPSPQYNPQGQAYGYYQGAGYGSQYGQASPSYGYGSGAYGVNGAYGNAAYSSYNNHLPSSYYKSIQKSSAEVQPSSYGSFGVQKSSAEVQPSSYGSVGVQKSSVEVQKSSAEVQPSSYGSFGVQKSSAEVQPSSYSSVGVQKSSVEVQKSSAEVQPSSYSSVGVQKSSVEVQPSSYSSFGVQKSSVEVQPSSYGSVGVQPSSYGSVGVQPSSYSSGGVNRYSVSNPVVGAVGSSGSSYHRSSASYQTVGVQPGVGYQSSFVGPQRVGYTSVNGGYTGSSNPFGSSNYIVLKKRNVVNAN